MEIKIPFDFKENLRVFMQRGGYSSFIDPYDSSQSYTKRLAQDFYPRFHVYINEKDNQSFINLHLDQKKPSYAGSHAHNGEYDGELVSAESQRLLGLIKNQMDNQKQKPQIEKRGFFSSLFK